MLASCAAAPASSPSYPQAAPEGLGARRSVEATHASRHMVAAANPHAVKAGLSILQAGGSAIDAAIAAQMVLNVVEPQSSGIGGGGFLLHLASGGQIEAFDGRETAPASARPDMHLRPDGTKKKFFEAAIGGNAVGVPGLLSMLHMAHARHGRLPWAALFQPAITLAEDGFPVSPRLHRLIAADKHLKTFPDTAAFFYGPDGSALPIGATLRNPPLARTLSAIAQGGPDAFYKGPIATDIAATIRNATVNPGGMTIADMAAYRTIVRDPICAPYRVWVVCGMGAPSSGGIATLQILGLLEGFDLAGIGPGSAEAVHLIAEASRLAFADRALYVADPDFTQVPQSGLIDPTYISGRAKLISLTASMGEAKPGDPQGRTSRANGLDRGEGGNSTTHISIVDSDGNVVSMTTSIENAFGSRMMVRGFLLNNQLTDFAFSPTQEGKTVANAAAPGKRPRSSMAPTIVRDAAGKPVLAIGSPGGSRIIAYVVKTLIGVLDWELDMQTAVSLPNFANRNGATEIEEGSPLERLTLDLEALGHQVRAVPMTSGLHGIRLHDGGLEGGADPRREGEARGE
ncbi:MAG: gamma-glutamyltransferase [Rhodospirillales bacterium]|nr:gamma-glutamyltransferase [Rhodospirillales bacterium]